MSREIRYVPEGWEHPEDLGMHIPLFDGSYQQHLQEWELCKSKWDEGLRRDYANDGWKPRDEDDEFVDWYGEEPQPEDYMPHWDESELTHMMMYETCTEGTPISPSFDRNDPEGLARWLADNGASAFGSMTATYEQWLATVKAGWAPGAVLDGNKFMSGVETMEDKE